MSREQNISYLVEMGFSRELATEAIKVNGYVEPAIAWCMKKQQESVGYTLGGTAGQTLGGGSGQTLGGGGQTLGGGSDSPVEIPPETAPEPPKKTLTPEEKEAQLKAIRDRIAERKAQASVDDDTSALQAEKHRREAGKEAQKAQEEHQKKQEELEALQKKRQKELDKVARERVMEQIRIDQLNRQAEEARRKGEVPQATQKPVEKANYTECVIQIRMPDGTKLQATFKPEDTLRTVLTYIKETSKDNSNFALMTTFPKKVFTGELLGTTLKDADLVPRGMLVVNKS